MEYTSTVKNHCHRELLCSSLLTPETNRKTVSEQRLSCMLELYPVLKQRQGGFLVFFPKVDLLGLILFAIHRWIRSVCCDAHNWINKISYSFLAHI